MNVVHAHLIAALPLFFVAITVSSGGGATALLATAGIVALAAVAIRLARIDAPHELQVGARAHVHREAISEMAAPRHPATAGRPRTRAPALSPLAA